MPIGPSPTPGVPGNPNPTTPEGGAPPPTEGGMVHPVIAPEEGGGLPPGEGAPPIDPAQENLRELSITHNAIKNALSTLNTLVARQGRQVRQLTADFETDAARATAGPAGGSAGTGL